LKTEKWQLAAKWPKTKLFMATKPNLSFDFFAFVAVFYVIGNGNIRFGFSSAVFPLAGGQNANQRG